MAPMARWEAGARERLVVAAVDLFTEQGYDTTTVAQIAARAGVTPRARFFRHFADKRELLVAGQETLSQLLAEGIAEAPPTSSPLEAVAAGLERASSAMGQLKSRAGLPPQGRRRRECRAAGARRSQRASVSPAAMDRGPGRPRSAGRDRATWPPSWGCSRSSGVTPNGPRAIGTPTTGSRPYTLAALDELRAASAGLG